jgi:tetratricopeptide (TPR) repeat protein/tRNA A-37 threonylcarbamoyl transferase component Bud32
MSDPDPSETVAASGLPTVAAAASDEAARPSSFVGTYRIVRELGHGGMGVVYEAEQQHPQRAVALKLVRSGALIDPLQIRLFDREAQAVARLKHPGIAAIYESGQAQDGRQFFAMELVQGDTLSRYVARLDATRPVTALRTTFLVSLFVKVCEAIAYAHQRGVIHRDLKPSNIVVSSEQTKAGSSEQTIPDIKVLDFGLARITDADRFGESIIAESGGVYGTLPYMSPEQVRGQTDELDQRTDVYSLGVMLYELIQGQLPYDVRNLSLYDAAQVICTREPARLQAVDRDLRSIVEKALDKDPNGRYQTASALADDLARYLDNLPIAARPASRTYHAYKFVRRHRVAVAFAVTIAVMLTTLAAVMTLQARRLAIERDRANREAETSRQISDYLTGIFAVADPSEARGNAVTAREILDRGAQNITSRLDRQPLVQARLMTVMGQAYSSLGLFKSSGTLLRQALDVRRAQLEGMHPDVAESLNLWGRALRDQGDYVNGEARVREALEMRQRLFGEEHTAVAESLNDLGTVLFAKGAYADAEPIFERALTMRRALLGDSNAATVDSLNDLAMTVEYLRADYPRVVAMLSDVLRFRRAQWGNDHPSISQAINNLAMAYYRSRDYTRAEPLFREALRINRRLFGERHPEVAINLNNLGLVLRDSGNVAGAEEALAGSLALHRDLLGVEHPETLGVQISLAAVKHAKGDYFSAESLYRDALEGQRKRLAESDYQVATTKGLLGATLSGARRYQEAEDLLLPAYGVIDGRFGEAHPRTQAMLRRIVSLYIAWGRGKQAEEFRRRIHE